MWLNALSSIGNLKIELECALYSGVSFKTSISQSDTSVYGEDCNPPIANSSPTLRKGYLVSLRINVSLY